MERFSDYTVVIAEDNDGLRYLIKKFLTNQGINCVDFGSGKTLIDGIIKIKKPILVLDYNLGDMTAEEVIECFNSQKLSVPFLILTGNSDTHIIVKMIKLGAIDWIFKNADTNELLIETLKKSITRINLDKENEIAKEQLQTTTRVAAVGQLAAGLAHEINNPLFIVIEKIDELCEKNFKFLDEQDRKTVQSVKKNLNRIKNIVASLNIFSQPFNQKMGIIDIRKSLETAIASFEEFVSSSNINLKFNSDPENLFTSGTEGSFQFIWLSLIQNAIEATLRKNNKIKHVVISSEIVDDKILVKIEDNGDGISEAHLKKIFDLFFTTKNPGEGPGLGLSIANLMLKEINGLLEVVSKENIGTTIKVILNRQKINSQELNQNNKQHTPFDFNNKRILVVDDEEDARILIARQYKKLGAFVETAASYENAIDLINHDKFDVISTDIKMPGKTGIDLIKAVMKENSSQKFVIVTGGDLNQFAKEDYDFISKYSIKVIVKPVSPELLRSL